MKHVNVSVKIIVRANKIMVKNTCICENCEHIKIIADTLVKFVR